MNLKTSSINISFIKICTVLIITIVSVCANAQQRELTTSNRRAINSFEEGIKNFNLMNYSLAEKHLKDAISRDNKFIEAYIVLGEMLYEQNKYTESIEYLNEAIMIDPDFYQYKHFLLASAYYKTGQYREAKEMIYHYLDYENYTQATYKRAMQYLDNCKFAIEAIKNPVPFEPVNLGESINSEFAEYSPVLTADGETLIFTRKKPRVSPQHSEFGEEYEDFYISFYENGKWTKAQNLGPPINTPRNEGAQSITADGRELFFTACSRPTNYGSCDIYYSNRVGDTWTAPQNLGPTVNSRYWDSQPSVSADGQTLYFTSGRSGNFGHMDIYVTHKDDNGRWTKPENLGEVINTTGTEMSAFIHSDNRTLYFASDGHIGMGGLDLFFSVLDDDGNWSEPVNLGYPINTHNDEMSIFVSALGNKAFFASDRLNGYGNLDIYYFGLYDEIKPNPLTYMKGTIFDSKTRQRLEANIELIDLKRNETIVRAKSDRRFGEFLVVIPLEKNLGLNISKEGYLFFSENFEYTKVREIADPHLQDIFLQPIEIGETVILRNIFFETAKYNLLPESIAELQRLIKLLNDNPGINIEIRGHTDNVGSHDYNLTLSKNRAKSVYNYLIDKGIDDSRLSYAGYSFDKPIDTNETAEGRANNRRTEFKITE